MRNPGPIKLVREALAGPYLPVCRGADQARRSRVKDDFAIEIFTLPLEAARRKVREILDRTTKNGHLDVVESWRQLSDGKIEFTTRLWPAAD
jgi:hypothetical protein